MKTTPEQREQWQQKNWKASDLSDLVTALYVVCIDLDAAERELAEMTKDRDLWRGDHNEDCPNAALLEAAERELKGCSTAAASYSEAVALGEPFGDAMKAVLICRQSLDAAIARYTKAERELAEQRERAEVEEEALRKIATDSNDDYTTYIAQNALNLPHKHDFICHDPGDQGDGCLHDDKGREAHICRFCRKTRRQIARIASRKEQKA